MTPQQFSDAYRPTAETVSQGTGIDPIALLAQWANETNWGVSWAGAPFNLGNIEDATGHVIAYRSLDDFAAACIATFHNGFYNPVLAATNAIDQLNAIVASPWAANHYGGSLMGFYTPLEGFELTPDQARKLDFLYNDLIAGIEDNPSGTAARLHRLETNLAALKAEVDTLGLAVSAIKAKTDKDLA